MTSQQIAALRQIGRAIVESVRAAGETGAPGGILYAALMAQGCTLNQFEQIMAGMVRARVLTQEGHVYFIGPEVQKLAA